MSLTLREAKRLYDLGFAVHWLHPKSKRPVESGWTSGPRKDWDYLKLTYMDGLNVGTRLGTPSNLGSGYLAVVDVDVKSTEDHHRREALFAARDVLKGQECPVVKSGRGNGSRHFYCLTAAPFKTFNPAVSKDIVKVHMPSKKPSKKEVETLTAEEITAGTRLSHAWEISLYSDGRQVVLPPSIHPDTGEQYHWFKHLTEINDLPLVSFDIPKEEIKDESDKTFRTGANPMPLDRASELGPSAVDFENVELSWLPISDKLREAITHGTGVTDRSSYLLVASSGLLSVGLSQNQVLSVLTDRTTFLGACGYEHARTNNRQKAAEWVYKYTLKRVAEEKSSVAVFEGLALPTVEPLSSEQIATQNEGLTDEKNWRQDLDKNEKGKPRVTLRNIDLILSNEVGENVFIKDLFANRIRYGVDTPWKGKLGSPLQDIDLILIKRWFADTQFQLEPATNAILEATSLIAHEKAVHPVRDWLGALKWDGVSRINTWIKDYCQGHAPEPYLSEVSRKFLLAMVKRVFEPGCQWDYVLVLEGEQGKYKSSIARALASDEWFMDNLPDLKDKDAMLNLQGKWLIELGELANIKRTDHNLVKAYLIRRTDTVRPHYGRIMEDVPRQSVFIGTVNEGEYLKDPTGNRRYWPVSVGECDVKGLKLVREQLFAEATHQYRTSKEVLMLSPQANLLATDEQEDRRVEDEHTEMTDAFIEFQKSSAALEFNFGHFKLKDLFAGPFAPFGKWGDKHFAHQNASQVLRNLGFFRVKIEGQRVWKKGQKRGTTGALGAVPQDVRDFF